MDPGVWGPCDHFSDEQKELGKADLFSAIADFAVASLLANA